VSLGRKLREGLPAPLRLLARRGRHAARHCALRLLVALRLQRKVLGRVPDLVHPQLYTDKVSWRMLYDRRPLLQVCSDRLAVRDYVAARAGRSTSSRCLASLTVRSRYLGGAIPTLCGEGHARVRVEHNRP